MVLGLDAMRGFGKAPLTVVVGPRQLLVYNLRVFLIWPSSSHISHRRSNLMSCDLMKINGKVEPFQVDQAWASAVGEKLAVSLQQNS